MVADAVCGIEIDETETEQIIQPEKRDNVTTPFRGNKALVRFWASPS